MTQHHITLHKNIHCIQADMRADTLTYTQTHRHTYTNRHADIHTCIRTYCIALHTRIHYINKDMNTYTNTYRYMHACIQACIHAYIHSHRPHETLTTYAHGIDMLVNLSLVWSLNNSDQVVPFANLHCIITESKVYAAPKSLCL